MTLVFTDSKIDYSGIPKQIGDVKCTRPSARYQSRINAVLREYVNAHRDVA
jgi:hypothetical protein